MLAWGAISELPISTLSDADAAATGIVTFRFSNGRFVTRAVDTPASTFYDPRMTQSLVFERALANGAGPMAFGGIATAVGTITLLNSDGGIDAFLNNYAVDGRRIRIKKVMRGDVIGNAVTILDGTGLSLTHDRNSATIRTRSVLDGLDLPVQTSKYGGTGGTDGGADLKNKPKPLCYGQALNVPAVIVDATNKIYQVNDGPVSDITAVYEGGNALTLTTDYTVDVANGRFTLLSSPARQITADVKGGTSSGTYVTTAADIARRILIDRCGYDASKIDINAFNQIAADQPAVVNLWIGPDQVSARDALDMLLRPLGIFLADTRAGQITIGRFASGYASDTLSLDQRDILDINRKAAPLDPPAKTLQVAYQRNWTVQLSDLAGAVTLTRKTFLAEQDRLNITTTTAGNAHIRAQAPDPIPALFANSADSVTELTRIAALYGVDRAVYTIRTPVGLWRCRLNQPVRLTYPRWNLRTGKTGYITRLVEDAQRNEIEIDVFV